MEKRDEYERQVCAIIARGVAGGCFVDCDATLVAFAVLDAVSWIPRWFDPAG
jgi:predicted HAD superfamily phosphohydrolase YqeG